MMFGFLLRTVSMSETCLSGLKLASVTAMTSIPRLPNSSAGRRSEPSPNRCPRSA